MRYLPSAPSEDRALLDAIGVQNAEDLLACIPQALHLKQPLNLPPGASELEVQRRVESMADRNLHPEGSFLGAGAYDHFVPAAIDAQISRQEWFTAYTPYQPEMAQGTLQHIFEYQTLMCDLTGLDVSNASLYDGATSTVEAAMVAVRAGKKRSTVLYSRGLHPHYREVLLTFLSVHENLKLVEVGLKNGVTDQEDLAAKLTDDVACFLVGYPNFFGQAEDLQPLGELVHARKALLVSVTQEAFALGYLEAPGKLGADIAIGDALSFGNRPTFGGPMLGFIAVKDGLKRELPGRVVGQTKDLEGRTGYVLTLTSREQHIRRDKATSNICSNQGLVALRANIFLQLAGPAGLQGLAEQNVAKAQYLRAELLKLPGVTDPFGGCIFNEFVLRHPDAGEVRRKALAANLQPGLDLGCYYPELQNCILWCATELNTREQMDRLLQVLKG